MIGQSYEERGFWQAIEQQRAVAAQKPVQSWPLGAELQQILGDNAEADPIFFEESWTLGLAAAMKNRQRRAEQSTRAQESRRFESLGTQLFVEQWEAEPVATPVSEERFAAQTEANLGWDRFTATRSANATTAMTLPLACQLLGVTTTSSRAQLRSAYRRMVVQWHPDRLVKSSEETRRLANDQMIVINQAYRMLCENQLAQAA